MNFFKSIKNKKGMSGAVKGAMIFLTLAFAIASASYIIPVLAIPQTTATITPVWLKPNTFYEFQIKVCDEPGSDVYISEVRLYNSSADPPTDPNLTIFKNFTCYADNDTSNPWDLGYGKSFGVIYCIYSDQAPYPTGTIGPGQCKNFSISATTDNNETCLHWTVEPRNTANGWSTVSAAYTCVDKTPPNTTKTYGTPTYVNGSYRWINSNTPITLTAVDGGPIYPPTGQVGVGVDKILYRITKLSIPDSQCTETCSGTGVVGSGDFRKWNGTPITIPEDSCHLIEFYANDSLGNTETIHKQCVYVDNQPPVSQKSFIGPTYTDGSGQVWINQSTQINLTCQDQTPHPSDNTKIYYRYQVDSGSWSSWTLVGQTPNNLFSYSEDSVHNLQWYCVDALNNTEVTHNETDRVDSTPPVITKSLIGPQVGTCPPKSPSDTCYIKDTTGGNGTIISVSSVDPDPTGKGCNVSQVNCQWGYYLDGVWKGMGGNVASPFNITFSDDSNHTLTIKCWDALGNVAWDNETLLVDSIPPVTTKTYGTPTVVNGGYRWINSLTPITLNATDNKVGVDNIQYRVTKLNISDASCVEACSDSGGSGNWTGATGSQATFTISQDSCHFIEYYAVDKLGNVEQRHYQCVFVDNHAPNATKVVGDPKVSCTAPDGDPTLDPPDNVSVPSGSGAIIDPNHLGNVSEPIVLNPGNSINESKIVTTSAIPIGKLDVVFLFDLTSSMSYVLDSAKANAVSIMDNITSLINDSQFGVGSFRDYPSEYSSCGYDDIYGDPEDLPWYFNQDITNNTAAVSTAISGFSASGGSDGPEAYARALYESSQDFSWRSGARKIVIIFGDNVPHDCDLGSYYDGSGTCDSTTGRDPGRDGIVNTSDDLPWFTVVSDLKSAGISVAFVDLSDGDACPGAWKYATNQTGGIYTLDTGNLPKDIVDSVKNVTSTIKNLTLEPETGFESWFTWTPTGYTDVNGGEIKDFNVTVKVPAGQPSGYYHFYIKVMGDGSILAVEEEFINVSGIVQNCSDGTAYSQCSLTKPKYCNSGTLIDNCSICGCSGGQSCNATTGSCYTPITPPSNCSDGTLYSQCSATKPLYCNSGTLINGCGSPYNCGCPSGQSCNATTNACYTPITGGCWYVKDHVTPVTLSCDDSWSGTVPHPVNNASVCYRISFDKAASGYVTSQYCSMFGGAMNGDWCCANIGSGQYVFNFTEDSNHDLEFYCTDKLGNKGTTTDLENFKVDSTPPIITKTLIGPRIGCGPSDTSCYIKDWNNSDGTTIHVEAVDNNTLGCAVDNVKCEWGYYLDGVWHMGQDDSAPPYDIKFNDDSNHTLVIKCWDALKNNVTDTETFLVDSIPPITTKTYGTPFYSDGTSDWITSQTPINLTSTDNKVGVDKTYYKYTKVDDSNCYNDTLCQKLPEIEKEWDSATPNIFGVASFTIPEDSCHLIEFYSADKLGNVETPKRQCVFVDTTGPTVNKIIGDPKDKWAGDNTFYPNLTARCAAGDIDCWKITLGTSLNLSCDDSWSGTVPHPVDHSKMCFQVELDGDDTTKDYCSEGQFNETGDGYCCVQGGIPNFQFGEESQHDLKVKCTDTLGNAGPVDEEKFKVEGCPEKICLSKKWNLISVPFVLFNDSPSEVFKNISDKIISVWSYGNGNWSTWVPGVGGTLTSIKPGYGYWILANDDGCFEIAGSLFSPQQVPPSRTLDKGWNLIGYYGNTGMNKDGMWTVDTVYKSQCKIADKPVYCALNSLIDTQEGFPRWSSLWNYFNNGNDKAGWTGLDACVDGIWATDKMEPFKGYWIEMDVSDGYAPATNCIWNTKLQCVPQFT